MLSLNRIFIISKLKTELHIVKLSTWYVFRITNIERCSLSIVICSLSVHYICMSIQLFQISQALQISLKCCWMMLEAVMCFVVWSCFGVVSEDWVLFRFMISKLQNQVTLLWFILRLVTNFAFTWILRKQVINACS